MKKILVNVTKEHIDRAFIDPTFSDPIQIALKEAGLGLCVVNSEGFTMFGPVMRHIAFPNGVGDRIVEFDLTKKMEPFQFQVVIE